MFLRSLAGLVGAAWVLLAASEAQAQCTKDTDCKGDRVCEGGACVAAPTPLPPAPAAPAGAAPATETAPPTAPAAAAPVAPAATTMAAEPPPSSEPPPFLDDPPVRRRHSTGMMVGGIVMVSFTPIALLVAAVANAQQTVCETSYDYGSSTDGSIYGSVSYGNDCDEYDPTIYGGLISAAVLAGVGIPMIVIGGKKELVTARVSPWATARSAGVGLRIDM